MISAIDEAKLLKLTTAFLEEYNSQDSLRKYSRDSAGHGIAYLLNHEYGQIYLDTIQTYVPQARLAAGIRVLEFGCGAGMNLLHLLGLLEGRGINFDFACGTDFSASLIAAAGAEANRQFKENCARRVRFVVARNENLIAEAAVGIGVSKESLIGSFDLIFGVNTIRYGHRLRNVDRCVQDIRGLLRPGGTCIVIDMNAEFPAFRSRLRDWRRKDAEATYLPTLDEYAEPFSSTGFAILKKPNFCWIPHSAGSALTGIMNALTPVLNVLARNQAMRSLVIARKPA